MNEPLASILHDHYNDTFAHIREGERERERLFLIVLALLGFVAMQLRYTLLLQQAVSEVSIFGVAVDPTRIPVGVLLSTSWTFLAALLVRYYRVVIQIEKQHDYLHTIERRLCSALDEDSISRESAGYLTKKFSAFRHGVWVFFTVLFPAIVVVVVGHAIYLEWCQFHLPTLHKMFDSAIALAVVSAVGLFTYGCWFKK